MSSGNVKLQAGSAYTFYLSDVYGGGWRSDGYGCSFVGLSFLLFNGSTFAGYPNWILKTPSLTDHGVAPGYQYENDIIRTNSISAMLAFTYTFQVVPQITTNIEDSSYNPPITSYIPSGTKFTQGKPLHLATDVYVWTLPNGLVVVYDNRGTDSFAYPAGVANSNGAFYTMLNANQTTPAAVVTATVKDVNNHDLRVMSPPLNMLPSKFRMTYRCTAYYTPRESGFTAAAGFNMTLKSVPGISNMQFPQSFIAATKQEGFGKVTAAHERNGMRYIAYNSKTNSFSFAAAPVGNGGTVLVPRSSCAVSQTSSATIPNTAHLTTEASAIGAAFGNQNFVVADLGGLEPDQIDLYWGVDDPRPSHLGSPASTSYEPNEGTPVVLTSY